MPIRILLLSFLPAALPALGATAVSVVGEAFHLNGRPTYAGREWEGRRVEGLLFNSRMVQATFHDRNPATRHRWALPDGAPYDPDRNTEAFLSALPIYRRHGLLAVTINLQGGSPQGYSKEQPWHNSAFAEDGRLIPAERARMERVLRALDAQGMVAILGLFYFGQDERLRDEAAVLRAVDEAVDWLQDSGLRNVLVEINNECDVRYDHAILQPGRVHELIERVRGQTRNGRRLLVSTSYGGGKIPGPAVVAAADYLLLHGNGVREPARLAALVDKTRAVPGYTPKPIVVNEDDHYDFDRAENHLHAATRAYASWGYFDFRRPGEAHAEGFQSVPVDWSLSSPRKRAFFTRVADITGHPRP
jgi:hypothetical protein